MLSNAPLAETADALRRGRIDVSEYIAEIRSRVESVETEIESLVPEEDRWDRLYEEAESLSRRYPTPESRPPLYGVPIGVKDIFHADGLPTRAGSDLPSEELTGPEAAAVSTLREAGAIVLGKTVTTEFAYMDPGPTRNPHDLDHTPGGSSSGSAAAVAAGLCPFAFGSQTVGSIIRPAAFCGVVGFKPTYDRVSTRGVLPLSTSVDHVGFFTQDVPGARLAASLLCEDWQVLPETSQRPTLGVPEGPYLGQASQTALDAFREQLDRLQEAGYEVKPVETFENIDEINDRHRRLVAADAALAHENWYREYADRYAPATGELIEDGLETPTEDIAVGRRGRHELRNQLEETMEANGIDCWIAPAAPGPAPEGIDTTGDPTMNLPWTHSGLPTITFPAEKTDAGLPLGVQCSAPFGSDEDLLLWADDLSKSVATGT